MPSISKVRVTNVVFEDGDKRFNDEVFLFDGHNGAILLENGGGKTVFIHSVLQAVLPHTHLGDRKIKETLQLENAPAHIGIEWIKNDNPRRYVTTSVSLFLTNNRLDSLRYVYEYDGGNRDALEKMPFIKETEGNKRPAERVEMMEYYSQMKSKTHNAVTFPTITAFKQYIEEQYQIISNEWENIVKINRDEGGIEQFFENCRTTSDLYDRLLIPTVEESIIGHDQGMFADLFEKQRSGFHTYKKLQESIKENEKIQLELETYVDKFAAFSSKQEQYKATKERAKGFWNVIQQQRMAMEKEENANEDQRNLLDKDKQLHNLKEESYDLLIEKGKSEQLEKAYKQTLLEYETASEQLKENNDMYHSLTYANYKRKQKQHQELLTQYESELAIHNKDDDLVDYEEEMVLENRKLYGFFQTKIEALEKTKQGLAIERRPLVDELNHLKTFQEEQTAKWDTLNERNIRSEEQLTMKREQNYRIKQQILANPSQEVVKVEQKKWIKRHQFLDDENIRLAQVTKQNEQKIESSEKEREELLEKKKDAEIQFDKKGTEEKQLQEDHDELVDNLATIRPSWGSLEDLYMRENAVYNPLLDMEVKRQKEQEELLYKERIAKRFFDDYAEQDVFFGDAFLNKQLTIWKNKFGYVVSGVEFYQGLTDDKKDSFNPNILWPLLLITTETAKESLLERIQHVAERMQFPVTVLTLEEVTLLGSEDAPNEWVAPRHWEMNLDSEGFEKWKREISSQAEKATTKREQKEQEITELKSVVQRFEAFFAKYPSDKREKLTTEISQLRNDFETIARESIEKRELIKGIKQEQTYMHANIQDYTSEINGLMNKISKASDYIQLEKELTTLEKTHNEELNKMADLKRVLKQSEIQMERYAEDVKELEDRKRDLASDLKVIEADEDFQQVSHLRPLFTDEGKTVILQRREELYFAIRKIQSSYSELVTKRDHEKENSNRIEKSMEDIHNKHESIDKGMNFPPDGENLLG